MPDRLPLRIFFASAADVFVDGQGNGEGIIATDLLTRLASRGHEVTACVGRDLYGSRPGLTVHELDRSGDSMTLQPFLRAKRALEVFRASGGATSFDVVHCLFPNWAPGFDARAYAPVPFVLGPIVTEWTGSRRWWPLGFPLRRLLGPVLMWRRRRTVENAALVVTAGPWVHRTVPSPRPPIADIPFGIDIDRFPASVPDADRFTVLYVGRYDEARGVLDLAEATRIAAGHVQGLKVIFVGDGPLRQQLERAARETAPSGTLEVRGPVPHEDVAGLLRGCSVFCMPSWEEPFGMAVIEAMSSGRAIIAGDAGALAEIVGDPRGGRLVPPRDAPGLAHAIIELASTPVATADMGRFNRQQVEANYDLSVVADRWEDVYRRVGSP